jgi:hypothetical protein
MQSFSMSFVADYTEKREEMTNDLTLVIMRRVNGLDKVNLDKTIYVK